MNTVRLILAGLLTVLVSSAFAINDSPSAVARAEIAYAISPQYSGATDPELARFKVWAEQRAAAFVPSGRKLVITITMIDMAGNLEPWRGSQYQDVRIVRDVYAPRIDLQFKLVAADGTTVSAGERALRSPGLPMTTTSVNGDDSLRFTKTLFNDWLAREFPQS